ncbi:symmetrical bis(5'-nucleosyl)-tetraphosphatase [Reinekea marina]|uniref:bis(5'-nucleosyl)-tetraphosphatase (symmetrical) n=1 Tax=Reinekea marina TaxID=1310421 RepID=A0ABV7WMQ6_9GAMM|nr:symmetrical bis(5'-nucleosyl)-tetraphosphatase [Reinekea marina]MDN3648314.1 symmetrical bis(5'-nucleosyl)-tetraphosphatase [Reinekea marina]
MSLYAVGDLQGCLDPLKMLLDHVNFDPSQDHLWLTGDLVNRGPNSAGCLRFVREMSDSASTVLGNHDLHLLAIHAGVKSTNSPDILDTLSSPTINEDLAWLVQQPLLIRDVERKLILTHAGIPPCWSDTQAIALAHEAEEILRNDKLRSDFLKVMYGNSPDTWRDELNGFDRIRYVINAFTRMRFTDLHGKLNFSHNGEASNAPNGMKPWFEWPIKRQHTLVFGHWAALRGITGNDDVLALDTGYVWGNDMTMMNLDSGERTHCNSNGLVFYQV